MLDRDGYRPNVGIILLNHNNKVFWAKRIRESSWQFPQGGINYGETPVQAMYRELYEEVGLKPGHVRILARTKHWLRYNVPDRFVRKGAKGIYKGQKQLWFLLKLIARESQISLRTMHHPEFDAWCWSQYWVSLDRVIDFKHQVYTSALRELAAYVNHTKSHLDQLDIDTVETVVDVFGWEGANKKPAASRKPSPRGRSKFGSKSRHKHSGSTSKRLNGSGDARVVSDKTVLAVQQRTHTSLHYGSDGQVAQFSQTSSSQKLIYKDELDASGSDQSKRMGQADSPSANQAIDERSHRKPSRIKKGSRYLRRRTKSASQGD